MCGATACRSSASTPSTSRCACSSPARCSSASPASVWPSFRWSPPRPCCDRCVGFDVEAARLRTEWPARERPDLELRAIPPAPPLPFTDDAFDLVTGIEVLEHVADPDALLAELSRVARGHVLVSVPREPLWRMLNLARGAHWRSLGDTPGHRQHFSRSSLARLASARGRVLAVRTPLPWTAALVQVASAAPTSAR